jgi:hypothetical protein
MKNATSQRRGLFFRTPIVCMMSLGICAAGLLERAEAESVDSELVLLVDITPRGLNNSEFDLVMDGYATAFTSAQVLDSIQSGVYGRIAVSLMFFGNAATQQVGIPWMMIGNATEAQQFAALARGVSRPFSIGSPSVSAALDAAARSFGSETGGTGNGFESSAQIIELVAATVPNQPSTAGIVAARDGSLASGVDLINSLAFGNRSGAIEDYYAANVIGGDAGGVVATSGTGTLNGTLADLLAGQVASSVGGGASASISAVPEPSAALGLLSGLGLLLIRRKRQA